MRNKIILTAALLFTLASCKKDIVQKTVYDNTVFGVNPVTLYSSNAEKTKQKSAEQFISILYSNLTNETVPLSDLNNLAELFASVGDKGLMNNMLLENFLNAPQIEIPTKQEMQNAISSFVEDTYLKFYLRKPSEYEKFYFTNMIQNDTSITPVMVYSAFAQSNEYLFY